MTGKPFEAEGVVTEHAVLGFWIKLRFGLDYSLPGADVTVAKIAEAARLLGLENFLVGDDEDVAHE